MRAAQPLELELGLVGTAGSATANGEEDEDEENLVLMPLQLRRVGVLLSTPEGRPTRLYTGTL